MLARESDHPRAYEVAGNLIKQVADVTEKLADLQTKMKKLKEVPNSAPKNVTNGLFVGSTAELQKMLKKKDDEKIDIDITNKCTLKCRMCARQEYDNPKDIPGGNLTVESFQKALDYFDDIYFCGSFGDPIFHQNFLDFWKCVMNKTNVLLFILLHPTNQWNGIWRRFIATQTLYGILE